MALKTAQREIIIAPISVRSPLVYSSQSTLEEQVVELFPVRIIQQMHFKL
jgi:hypothetical protein